MQDACGAWEVVRAEVLEVVHPLMLVIEDDSQSWQHIKEEAWLEIVASDLTKLVLIAHMLLELLEWRQEAQDNINDPNDINHLFQRLCVLLKDVHHVLAAWPTHIQIPHTLSFKW